MTSHVALLRAVNVGGKNLFAMSDVAAAFEAAGFSNVSTFGQSGNVLFESEHPGGPSLELEVEKALHERFQVPIVVLTRSLDELSAIIAAAPAEHGADHVRSDVFFLKHPLTAEAAFDALPELREGVDLMSTGPGVLYFSRVTANATKTRVQKVLAMPMFQHMTVRTWRVTNRLRNLLAER